jgi:hypothetical protein
LKDFTQANRIESIGVIIRELLLLHLLLQVDGSKA